MARGWDSKSVESQKEDADLSDSTRDRLNREEIEMDTQRRALELSRRRVTKELEQTRSELRRENLRNALAYLDQEIRKLHR